MPGSVTVPRLLRLHAALVGRLHRSRSLSLGDVHIFLRRNETWARKYEAKHTILAETGFACIPNLHQPRDMVLSGARDAVESTVAGVAAAGKEVGQVSSTAEARATSEMHKLTTRSGSQPSPRA